MSEAINTNQLIGTWLGKSEAGSLKAEFTEEGMLFYTISYGEKEFFIEFSYQVEDSFLLLKQPESAVVEKTEFILTENKLMLKRNEESWLFIRAIAN